MHFVIDRVAPLSPQMVSSDVTAIGIRLRCRLFMTLAVVMAFRRALTRIMCQIRPTTPTPEVPLSPHPSLIRPTRRCAVVGLRWRRGVDLEFLDHACHLAHVMPHAGYLGVLVPCSGVIECAGYRPRTRHVGYVRHYIALIVVYLSHILC